MGVGLQGAMHPGEGRTRPEREPRPCVQLGPLHSIPKVAAVALGGWGWGWESGLGRMRAQGPGPGGTGGAPPAAASGRGARPARELTHVQLCPGAEDLAQVRPCHSNPVYRVGSPPSFSDGPFFEAILVY